MLSISIKCIRKFSKIIKNILLKILLKFNLFNKIRFSSPLIIRFFNLQYLCSLKIEKSDANFLNTCTTSYDYISYKL